MIDRFLHAFSTFVTRRPIVVLALMGILTLVCGLALPRLQTESSPENLIISFGGYEERLRAFREHFGDTDNIVVLLVESDDAMSVEALRYEHQLAQRFQNLPQVLRVDGLTVTALPRAPGADTSGTGSLDDLDNLDNLDAQPAANPEAEAALQVLIDTDPSRFPLGLLSVAERVTDADTHPIVAGDTVTEAEAEMIRQSIEESPLVVGQLVSEDRTLAAVVVRLATGLGTGNERLSFVNEMDTWLDANPPPAGITLHRAGLPHLRTAIARYMQRDQMVLIPLTVLVCVILLYLSFRWIPGTILPLVAVGVCVVQIVGVMAIVGEPMTILTNVLPTLIIIIELSNSVHLITRWEEELAAMKVPDSVEASARALRTMAVACFLTSFTSAVGLGSLMVSDTEMLRRFGLISALGTMLAYFVTILVIPATLTFLKPPRFRSLESETPTHTGQLKKRAGSTGLIERAMVLGTRALLRKPWLVLGLTTLVVVPMFALAGSVEVDTSLHDTFNEGDPVVIAVQRMDQRMDGIRPLEILLSANTEGRLADPEVVREIVAFEQWAAAQDGVLRATSFTDYLLQAWTRIAGYSRDENGARTRFDPRDATLTTRAQVDALRSLLSHVEPDPAAFYLTQDARYAHVELRIGDIGARRSGALIDDVEREAERRFAPLGLSVSITGEAYIGSRGIESVVNDLVGSLGLSILLIFITLVVLFRSVRFAAIAVPPNVLPLVTTVAWMVLRGIPLNAGTAVVFSIAVGVGVDGTIHALARFREEYALSGGATSAIVRTARGTGRAVVISALTLMLGFAVLLLSSFVPIQHFGELIAAAMTASLFSTLIVQPVLVKLFAKPSKKKKA